MKIGLTYDLREEYLERGFGLEETAEFDKPETIDALDGAVRAMGHETERIGSVLRLVEALAAGRRWDLVFNIAEGLYGIGREAQVPALLDAYQIPYTFSDPLVSALTLDKGMTKRVIRDLGVPTPDFAVVHDLAAVSAVTVPFPVFVKPIAEGTGKGIDARSRATTPAELRLAVEMVLDRFRQPALVEEYLPGREFTVGLVGTGPKARALGALEVVLLETAEAHGYTYFNKENFEGRVRYDLVRDEIAEECSEVALAAWRGLGCRDGGRVDLRVDARGCVNFLEVNPLAGLNPVISDLPILCSKLGISFQSLIEQIVLSAMERVSER